VGAQGVGSRPTAVCGAVGASVGGDRAELQGSRDRQRGQTESNKCVRGLGRICGGYGEVMGQREQAAEV
jgi:hypothetical protein